MQLGQAKARLFALLDETGADSAMNSRLDHFFDIGQREICLYYPIYKRADYAEGDPRALPEDCFAPVQLIGPGGDARAADAARGLPEGAFTLVYQARPDPLPSGAADDTPLSLPDEAADALVFFVAAQCMATEQDQRFFQNFFAEYQGRLAGLSGMTAGPAAVVEVRADADL